MCLAAILLRAVKAHFFNHSLGEDTKSPCLTTGQSKMPSEMSPSTTTPPQCPKVSRNDMVTLKSRVLEIIVDFIENCPRDFQMSWVG